MKIYKMQIIILVILILILGAGGRCMAGTPNQLLSWSTCIHEMHGLSSISGRLWGTPGPPGPGALHHTANLTSIASHAFTYLKEKTLVAFYSTSFVALSDDLTLHVTIATKQCLLHDKSDAEIVKTIAFSKLGLCQNYFPPETIVFLKPGVLLKL